MYKSRGHCIEERRQSTEPYTAGTTEKINLVGRFFIVADIWNCYNMGMKEATHLKLQKE